MTLQQQLARLERQLYEQEHHARHNLGILDRAYLDRQARRRELTLAWMQEMQARIRELEREIAALRGRVGEAPREAEVVLTAEGFRKGD